MIYNLRRPASILRKQITEMNRKQVYRYDYDTLIDKASCRGVPPVITQLVRPDLFMVMR